MSVEDLNPHVELNKCNILSKSIDKGGKHGKRK